MSHKSYQPALSQVAVNQINGAAVSTPLYDNNVVSEELKEWFDRQQAWFVSLLESSKNNIERLRNGGFIKQESDVAGFKKIISAWLSKRDYQFEQRVDYPLAGADKQNRLGLKNIHISRSCSGDLRIGLECKAADHYAALYTALEAYGLPISSINKWAMLPYYYECNHSNVQMMQHLLVLLEAETGDTLIPVIQDLRQLLTIA